jgi:hypothetical protein
MVEPLFCTAKRARIALAFAQPFIAFSLKGQCGGLNA